MKRRASARFTVSSRITEHGQTLLNISKGNEEEEGAKTWNTSRVHYLKWTVGLAMAAVSQVLSVCHP